MDHFGIGPALQALLRMYAVTSRGSGRTTSLVKSVRDGDRIICATNAERRHLLGELPRKGVDVEVVVIPVHSVDMVAHLPPQAGRTLFDHPWVEGYYTQVFADAMKHLDTLQDCCSKAGALLGVDPIKPNPDMTFPSRW